jgi:hypothetical protein
MRLIPHIVELAYIVCIYTPWGPFPPFPSPLFHPITMYSNTGIQRQPAGATPSSSFTENQPRDSLSGGYDGSTQGAFREPQTPESDPLGSSVAESGGAYSREGSLRPVRLNICPSNAKDTAHLFLPSRPPRIPCATRLTIPIQLVGTHIIGIISPDL